MATNGEVIAEIVEAFGRCPKPEHFTDYRHCDECAEHDQLLRDRTLETLRIEDVGNVCWDPICFSNRAGIAYYFPALARLALSPPTYDYGWYADLLLLHLTSDGADNRLLGYFDVTQRRAVRRLLDHLHDHLWREVSGGMPPLTETNDLVEAQTLWSEP